jgi:hypothetical protein
MKRLVRGIVIAAVSLALAAAFMVVAEALGLALAATAE